MPKKNLSTCPLLHGPHPESFVQKCVIVERTNEKQKRNCCKKVVNKDTDAATKNRKISSTIVSLLAYTDQTELPLFV